MLTDTENNSNTTTPIKTILRSLATVLIISTLCSTAVYVLTSKLATAVASFVLATALQYLAGYLVAAHISSNYKNSVYMAELEKLEKLSTILNCSYCNAMNVFTFLPNEVPEFVCDNCKNTNSVKLQFTVARTTSADPSLAQNILKEPQKNHNIQL